MRAAGYSRYLFPANLGLKLGGRTNEGGPLNDKPESVFLQLVHSATKLDFGDFIIAWTVMLWADQGASCDSRPRLLSLPSHFRC